MLTAINKLSSLLILLSIIVILPSCSPSYLKGYKEVKISTTDPFVFNDNFEKVVYKTNLEVMGNELSGILIVKKIEDNETRFVFISELGLKYFDLGIKSNVQEQVLTTYYIMPALNRGRINELLFDNFSKLLPLDKNNFQTLYYQDIINNNNSNNMAVEYKATGSKSIYFSNNNKVFKIVWKSDVSGSSSILLSEYKNSIPQQIKISNGKYGLSFDMTELKPN